MENEHLNKGYFFESSIGLQKMEEHDIEGFMDTSATSTLENEGIGFGDADEHGCWYRFKSFIRRIWATRQTENVNQDTDLYIKTTLRELFIYVFFIVTVVTIAFGISNGNEYFMTRAIRDSLMTSTADGESVSLETATTVDDFWIVLNESLFNNLYQNKWYNEDKMATDNVYFVAYDSLLLGLPRLRQLRMSSNSCSIPDDFESQIKTCYSVYNAMNADRTSYGYKNSTAWIYTSPENLSANYHVGKVSYYDGGGYYIDLPSNRSNAKFTIAELFKGLWIDRSTRAVFLHLTVYNPNINLFCVVVLLVEIPATGGIITSGEFRTVKLIRYVTTKDYVILGFECLFILFILYYIAEETIEIFKLKWKYFCGFWNYVDIFLAITSCICISYNVYRLMYINKTINHLLSKPDEYYNFESLSILETYFNLAVGILVFLVWIKIFKYVSFNKTMNQLNLTLGNCTKDLVGFAVMFSIVLFAFAQLGLLAFGTQLEDFSSFTNSLLTLVRIILGDFDFLSLRKANRIFGPIYFLVYIFFVFFVLVNMFIAIINDTYLDVKSNMLTQPNEIQMKSYFKKRLRKMRRRMNQKKYQLQKIQNAIIAVEKDDCDMTFTDLKHDLSIPPENMLSIFKSLDTNRDEKLSADEKLALKKSLESKKIQLMEDMVNFQETEIGQSYDDAVKFISETMASKEDLNFAFERLIRLENCLKTVSDRMHRLLQTIENEANDNQIEAIQKILQKTIKEDNEI